jgi:hypothetical protein
MSFRTLRVREFTGFVVNTVGVGGLFDIATIEGIRHRTRPYLVLPLFPPSTIRDTIGSAVDGLIRRNDCSTTARMNQELFEEVEDSVLDLYSGTRNPPCKARTGDQQMTRRRTCGHGTTGFRLRR